MALGSSGVPNFPLILMKYRFGELIRKLWNVKNFKAHVSPHEMLQAVVLCSKKKFQITEQVSAQNYNCEKADDNLSQIHHQDKFLAMLWTLHNYIVDFEILLDSFKGTKFRQKNI